MGRWRYRLASRLAGWLPPALGYGLAAAAAALFSRIQTKRRRVVARNLALIMEAEAEDCDAAARRVFRHFGYYLYEFFSMHRLEAPAVALEGLERLKQAQRAGRGVILLTAHLGNWELGAKTLQDRGYPLSAVAQGAADALFERQRRDCGTDIIPLDAHATRKALSALRGQRLLALLVDRDFMGDGVGVKVGGGMLRIPRGPAVLSLRTQAPIVPAFFIREGRWRFRLICKPAIWPIAAKTSREAVSALIQAYANVLEEVLRRYSDQWLMFEALLQDK